MTQVGGDSRPLDSANRYIMHFAKGELPPVNGFWSVTMYDPSFFFVPNPLDRYTVSSRFPFTYNPDGSLDVYIQRDSPGKDKEANWLPAPQGKFILMLRLYWPKEPVLTLAWKPPGGATGLAVLPGGPMVAAR